MKKQKHVKWYQSLVSKFTLLVVPLAIFPLFIVSYIHYIDSTDSIKERTYADIKQSTLLQKKFLQNWFHYREIDIKNLSQSSNVVELMTDIKENFQESKLPLHDFVQSDEHFASTIDMSSELTRFQHDYDYVYDVFLIDLEGNILYTNEQESDLGTSLTKGPYSDTRFANAFRQTLEDKQIHFSDLELYAPSNNKVVGFLTAPIIDSKGIFIGVFAIEINLERVYALFQENTFIKKEVMQTYLVGMDGVLRSPLADDYTQILKMKIQIQQFKLWSSEHDTHGKFDSDENEKISVYTNPLGKKVFGLHHDIHILGVHWALVSEADIAIIKNLQKEIIDKTLYIAMALLIVIIAITMLLFGYLVQPILNLIEMVKKFEDGNREVEIKIHSTNEIGALAEHFDAMVKAIKQSEIELDEQKFALNAHSIVAVTDVAGKITYVNAKFEEISGYTKEELIGENHRILNSKDKPKEYWKGMYDVISNGLVWRDEIKNINKEGEEYWVDTTIVPFVDNDGKITSYVAIRTDITEKKKDEFALIEAKKIADESLKVKAEFFASMSHEIRTPMNGIIGMLSLLLKTPLSQTQHHQAYLAQTSAQALLNLINDILDFSKFEANKLALEHRAFDIHDDFGDFAEAIAFKAQEKGVEVILDMKDVAYQRVIGDGYRIKQILNNLVSNAIKFTDKGYVLITSSLIKINEEDARLRIVVQDTGIGIAEDKIKGLFDSFSQVDNSTTRKYGGTGLGLAIVKQLVEIMDGTIEVSSKEGEGSRFSIDIAVKLDKESKIVTPDVKDKKVLIVDKCKISTDVLAKQLRHWGMYVSVEKESGIEYDIIFILKDDDALELGKSLKEEYKNARLILMTSLADTVNVNDYMESVYDMHFPQPATTQDILKALHTLMRGYHPDEIYVPQTEGDKVAFNPDAKILLVDDNKVNQLVALGLLEELGLDADVANNGLEAIKTVENAGNAPYEIILMDCQMPEMDGYEATRELKSGKYGENVAKIPIVAMTANAMEGDKEKCFASGMDDYISKPIDPQRLEQVLRKYLLTS